MVDRPPLVETRRTGEHRVRGVVSPRAEPGRVQVQIYEPPTAIADVVATLWSGSWDLRGALSHTTQQLSDPCVNIVFEHGGQEAGARVVGVWTRLWQRTLSEQGHVRGVKLRSGALRTLFETPAHRFSNGIVRLSEVVGYDTAELEAAVLTPQSDDAAFAVVEDWLQGRRSSTDPAQSALAIHAADLIEREPQITSVAQLVEATGLSERMLQRLFRDYVGASPKWVIRRHRLREAASRIESGDADNLAWLAAELGYVDQAHFARDFKNAVGLSPSAFRKRMRPTPPSTG